MAAHLTGPHERDDRWLAFGKDVTGEVDHAVPTEPAEPTAAPPATGRPPVLPDSEERDHRRPPADEAVS